MEQFEITFLKEKEEEEKFNPEFVRQYYGLLCTEPNQMHHFYAEHSTMILVIGGDESPTIIASGLNHIHNVIMALNVEAVEIKSCNSHRVWGDDFLLVVLGSMKIKDGSEFQNFVHSLYLAPYRVDENKKAKGCFIITDILHIINFRHETCRSNPVLPCKFQDIDPRFLPKENDPSHDINNGNLDEAMVKKLHEIKDRMLYDAKFPMLQQNQQPRRQRSNHLVSKIPSAKVEASSSNSFTVVTDAADTIHENMDALKIEEPAVVQEEPSNGSYKSKLHFPGSSTSRGRGRGRGRGNRDNGK